MHKFTSEYGEGYQPEKIEITVSRDADLTEMVESFTYYLKACGYHIPEGHALDFVPEDGWSDRGWDDLGTVTDDFNPRGFDEYGNYGENNPPVEEKKKLWDATPEEWNQAYKSVTMTFNGKPVNE